MKFLSAIIFCLIFLSSFAQAQRQEDNVRIQLHISEAYPILILDALLENQDKWACERVSILNMALESLNNPGSDFYKAMNKVNHWALRNAGLYKEDAQQIGLL